MADRLAVMHQGILQQVGAPEEVYNLPVNRFVAGFLGDANFIDGTVTENGLFRSHFGEFQLAPTAFRPETGRKITAAIRPERIRFAARKGEHTFSAKLTDRTFLGECCEWKFDANGAALEVTESAPPMRRIGDVCELEFDPGHLIALQG